MHRAAWAARITKLTQGRRVDTLQVREDLSILDKFKLIKSLGFDGVELDSPNNLNRKEVIEAAAEAGVQIPGVVNSMHWKNPC